LPSLRNAAGERGGPSHEAQAARRHHFPGQKHRVNDWAAYDAGLRARGSLAVWFTPEAVVAWKAEPRTGGGGQHSCSALAIVTALMLRSVFRLAPRQTEGLIGSVLRLLGLNLAVPDHSTLSRRAETLEVPRPRRKREPARLPVDSTGLRLCGPAGGWRRSTAPGGAGPGGCPISPRTPTPSRSSPRC
jgi:Transposase DDE domain